MNRSTSKSGAGILKRKAPGLALSVAPDQLILTDWFSLWSLKTAGGMATVAGSVNGSFNKRLDKISGKSSGKPSGKPSVKRGSAAGG